MHHYNTTIVVVRLMDSVEKVAKTFEANFGAVKSYPVRRELLKQIKADLVKIMTDAVNISLDYFYAGKERGKMDSSLRKGIKVKGQSLLTVSAILNGIDYTSIHEENTKYQPRSGKMIAIPLPDACYSDGKPKMSSPDRWKQYNTFVISGSIALNTYNRKPANTQINPHPPEKVGYIVYRDKATGNLVYLYKLVPYSFMYEGYTNYKGNPLKKLGLRQRIDAGIRSAVPGWARLVWDLLETIPDYRDLEAYKGIKVNEFIDRSYASSYNKGAIPKGRANWDVLENIENVAFLTYKAITA